MDQYHVLRLGSVFRIIYMEAAAAEAWKRSGWEVRVCDTNTQAQADEPRDAREILPVIAAEAKTPKSSTFSGPWASEPWLVQYRVKQTSRAQCE